MSAGAVGAGPALGTGGDAGSFGGEGFNGSFDAFSDGAQLSMSYLHNFVPTNELNDAGKPQEVNRSKSEEQKQSNFLADHIDILAFSEELMDEMQQDDQDGKRPTSIWPPRRT